MAKKKCFRVQVGDAKLGLISKCLTKKDAEMIGRMINQGGMYVWVNGKMVTS